eukprot:349292-Pyramimonas_sp.AAC.1
MAKEDCSDPYLQRNAKISRDSIGVHKMHNADDFRAHALFDVRQPRFIVEEEGIRVPPNYYVTPESLLLVVSFTDARTQSKHRRVRDLLIEQNISNDSELSFLLPSMRPVWGKIFRAGVAISLVYKKRCVDELSCRVMSFDPSCKYALSIVGQEKHWAKKESTD